MSIVVTDNSDEVSGSTSHTVVTCQTTSVQIKSKKHKDHDSPLEVRVAAENDS